MKIKCDKCRDEFEDFGALVFSPPETLEDGTCAKEVNKYHICPHCFSKLIYWIEN